MNTGLSRPSVVTAVAGALTLASISATAGFLLGRYELLPRGLPVHFENGQPDRWVMKSYALVFAPFWTQLLLAVVIGGIAAMLLWRAHHANPADQAAREDRDRMLVAAEAIALLGFVWISFQVLMAVRLTELWLNLGRGGMGVIYDFAMITAVVTSVVIGARAAMQIGRPVTASAEDGDVWRLKALYFNPTDPALFVPTRYGYGLTLNFGRPFAIAIMVAILLVGLGGPLLLARALLR
jgi:uncharacterized membrane protein